jgi:hypothetical protein
MLATPRGEGLAFSYLFIIKEEVTPVGLRANSSFASKERSQSKKSNKCSGHEA